MTQDRMTKKRKICLNAVCYRRLKGNRCKMIGSDLNKLEQQYNDVKPMGKKSPRTDVQQKPTQTKRGMNKERKIKQKIE